MYRVLLAVDANEDRAETAAKAVSELPGELYVVILNVFEEFDTTDGDGRIDSSELYDESDFPESVSIVERILQQAEIETVKRREHGDPTDVILEVADEIDADSIALSGRKRSPVGKAVFGSVTQSVVLSADRPVIITTSD